jgi:asparagine synthetase B (glutamine-hydrolysing)
MLATQTPTALSHDLLLDVRAALESAVERNRADAILLSGGLDTSIVVALTPKGDLPGAYTISL